MPPSNEDSQKPSLSGLIHAVETFFDRIKLGYKWRFDRWEHLNILTYRGYGTKDRLYLRGRVLDDQGIVDTPPSQSVWQNMRDTIRRIETDEVPGARVRLTFQDRSHEAETDGDGFFEFNIEPGRPLPADRTWHEVDLELLAPRKRSQGPVRATGHILVPRPDVEFGVISDMDDTVMRTGATNRLQMIRTVLLNNAHTRVPFEGIAAFYEALQHGPDGRGVNPIFYISSSPWNLYDLFDKFIEAHDIPSGPIFLKDFGFSEAKLFTAGHQEYKQEHIRLLLKTYPDLPFVLIGDSGQEDPEVYHEIVREHPGRIRAIYIRDVTPPKRDQVVHRIAEQVKALGVPMVLVEETLSAAAHAAEHGMITEAALGRVREDKQREEAKQEPSLLERVLG